MTHHADRRYSLRELADHAGVRQELDLADDAAVHLINWLASHTSPPTNKAPGVDLSSSSRRRGPKSSSAPIVPRHPHRTRADDFKPLALRLLAYGEKGAL